MSRRRVVITGVGAVSSLGLDLPTTWGKLLEGQSGAGLITKFDTEKHTTKFACEVWDWNSVDHFPKTESKRLELFTMYYLVAASEAMKSSGLDMDGEDRTRAGCAGRRGAAPGRRRGEAVVLHRRDALGASEARVSSFVADGHE